MFGILDDRAIEHLLQSAVVARIACYADEKLYVVRFERLPQGLR